VATCVISATATNLIPAGEVASRPETPERSLVQRAQQGDEEAFGLLFQAHKKRVFSVCLLMTKDTADAEDLTQEAFLQVFRSIGSFRGDSAFSTWLYRVAVRMGLDELRRQTRRTRYERLLGFGGGVQTPEDIRRATEEQERVRLVLGVINRRHAELLLLRSDDFSYDEVASALDLNPASIGTLLSRAQQAFRKEYIKRYGEQ